MKRHPPEALRAFPRSRNAARCGQGDAASARSEIDIGMYRRPLRGRPGLRRVELVHRGWYSTLWIADMPPRTDSLGNPITLQDETSATALNDFVEGFIACEARAVNVLNAAADTSPIVQAGCAALHMFAESADAPRNARPFIDQALARAADATEREQRFVAAIAAWVDGDLPRAIALHEE